nr:hypothetical protein BaRGS_033840 [Batillaria attramentaria]
MQQVMQSIRQLAERRQEVMMVLSQLEFRKYLDNQVDPISAAATRLLPRPATLGNPDGDFDVLIISRRYGLIVGEVKSVGAVPQYTDDQAIVNKVKEAVDQLKKAGDTVEGLVSDLAPVHVTRILMLPNITSQQLMTALSTAPQTEQFQWCSSQLMGGIHGGMRHDDGDEDDGMEVRVVFGQEVYNMTIRSLKVFGQEVYNMTIRSLKVFGQEVYNITIRSLKVFGQEVNNMTIRSPKGP